MDTHPRALISSYILHCSPLAIPEDNLDVFVYKLAGETLFSSRQFQTFLLNCERAYELKVSEKSNDRSDIIKTDDRLAEFLLNIFYKKYIEIYFEEILRILCDMFII